VTTLTGSSETSEIIGIKPLIDADKEKVRGTWALPVAASTDVEDALQPLHNRINLCGGMNDV
jgi:hypothetical protein